MSALLSLHRAAVCRRNGRLLLLTLSRQNSRVLANVWPSSGGVRGVLRRLANDRLVLLSKSEQRPLSQQQSVIQVSLSLDFSNSPSCMEPDFSAAPVIVYSKCSSHLVVVCILNRAFSIDRWVGTWWGSPMS